MHMHVHMHMHMHMHMHVHMRMHMPHAHAHATCVCAACRCCMHITSPLPPRLCTGSWGFKYDSEQRHTGINTHADDAAVNLNFWLTPDEANLEPTRGGGITVYEASVIGNRTAESKDYNQRLWDSREWAVKKVVPYRSNRAVLFPSSLYHKSDDHTFKTGYTNRRINFTLLFGLATAVRCAPFLDDEAAELAQRGILPEAAIRQRSRGDYGLEPMESRTE